MAVVPTEDIDTAIKIEIEEDDIDTVIEIEIDEETDKHVFAAESPRSESCVSIDGDEHGDTSMTDQSVEAEKDVKCMQMISIVSDKQELGFVEKVHIEEERVFRLCNRLVEGSIERHGKDVKIKYNDLNGLSLPAIGMYGDKAMMLRMLQQIDAVDEETKLKMEKGEFEPGLYVCRMAGFMVVFYWHKELRLEPAARNQISCNFIRYLIELCDDVYVFVEEDNLLKALSALSSINDSKYGRTTTIKISQVQNSSNDVQISQGFDLDIARSVKFTVPQGLRSVPERRFFFTGGYHRCAFLTPAFKESTKNLRNHPISATADEIMAKIQSYSKEYYVDFTHLDDAAFVLLLEHSGSSEHKAYKESLESFKSIRDEEDRKFNIQSKLLEAEKTVRDAFIDALPEVCSYFKFAEDGSADENSDAFRHLEQTIASVGGMCAGSQNQQLVFSGSNITFRNVYGQSTKYSVELCKGNAYKGPIMNGQELSLKCSKGKSQKVWFSYEHKYHSLTPESKFVMSGEDVRIVKEKNREAGVISSVETPNGVFKMFIEQFLPPQVWDVQKNFHVLCFNMRKGSEEELRSFWRRMAEKLEKDKRSFPGKEIILAFYEGQEPLKSLDSSIIEKYLIEGNAVGLLKEMDSVIKDKKLMGNDVGLFKGLMGNPVGLIRKLMGNVEVDSVIKDRKLMEKYNDLCGFELDIGALSRGSECFSEWKNICSSVCKHVKELSKENILAMIRRRISAVLSKQLTRQKDVMKMKLDQHLKEEKSKFLMDMKEKFSGGSGERRMSVTTCTVENKFTRFAPTRLHLLTSIEEIENPKVRWMVTEVVPNKKDLEQLSMNSMHCITPSCSEPCELLTMDPEIEDLRDVEFLKSGELLLFIHDRREKRLNLYVSPKLGPHAGTIIHSFRRGFDLVAFEESTRYLALYDREISKIMIYRFGEKFRNADHTGVQIRLDIYGGSSNLKCMMCIPGKAELLTIDDTNRIRVFELHHQPLMKPRYITLSSDFVSGCISPDGSFLFLLEQNKQVEIPEIVACEEDSHDKNQGVVSEVQVQIYLLADSMSFLKSLSLNVQVQDPSDLQLNLIHFGGQNHLVIHSRAHHDRVCSNVLTITSASEVLKFQELSKHESDYDNAEKQAIDQSFLQSCATLDYVYHIYDKFAVYPALCDGTDKQQSFHLLLKQPSDGNAEKSREKCKEYLRNLIRRLEMEKGKDFSKYKLEFNTCMFDNWKYNDVEDLLLGARRKEMGAWIRQLVCLVPVQICRAYNNGVQPLLDGLQIPSHLSYADSISLANLLRFGLYDAILGQWDGIIKVISSMGKQSSGKSFLLNHLSGSLLDVAGGRCTEGVWMTVRVVSNCLYVLMDFEGLGSFERTEQEDMLLSVLNAAVSNLTIFNKKDFHLDKETEATFQRFQNGVNLVKHDEKLFKGLFYIAIKDVDVSDVKELKEEFQKKLLQICQKSKENFLTKMYRGEVAIATMPPFTRQEYYKESLADVARSVEKSEHCYENGRAFLTDLKLLISQIAAKDWTPVDMKRVAMRVDILRKNMVSAVKAGCLATSESLMKFDKEEVIADTPLELKYMCVVLPDTGLVLESLEETTTKEKVVTDLRLKFEEILHRRGEKNEYWHATFQEFLEALADRRRLRVQKWIQCNTVEFPSNNEVQKLQLEANLALAELNQGLSVCGSKCSVCFWRCVLEKGHCSDHSCMGNHVCSEKCTFCSLDSNEEEIEECQSLAGHDGNHDCKRKNHTCGKACHLFDKSSNCSKSCCLRADHEGPHKCNSPQHVCGKKCSLAICRNSCVIQIETGDHEKHVCQERYCPEKCIMKGCRRSCGYEDHFHSLSSKQHLCGSEHSCQEKCREDGICEIFTELVRQVRYFHGRRDSFEYEHVSEQNGLKKDCCVTIPPFEISHEGDHIHTLNPDAVHYCDVRCEACGYFCQRPINHPGLHNTVHGNMRNVNFVSEKEEVDIEDRKYTWGESGVAEMCNMHCKAQGRGHVHLILCPKSDNMSCTSTIYDGARHETKKYGPDLDVPKDELTHDTYWRHIRFEDPCTEEDRNLFALCNHLCSSEEHNEADGTFSKSYCTEKLWHQKVGAASVLATGGHITPDGHVFSCNHSRNVPHHCIFVIDKSGSMGSWDMKPNLAKFVPVHNCRLGCVYEAILRFISTRRRTTTDDTLSIVLFDHSAIIPLETQEMKEDAVDKLLGYVADGGTSYSNGLRAAEEVIVSGSKHPSYSTMKPVIIFLSDGGNNDGSDPVYHVTRLKNADPRMMLHTIMFGTDPETEILKRMATAGNGTFQHSLDEVMLARSFESIADSLKPSIAALM